MPESNRSLLSTINQTSPGVILPPESCFQYKIDDLQPSLVVKPNTTQEVSNLLKWSSAESQKVSPWGGGTQIDLGNLPDQLDMVMDLSKLNDVISFQPADLTVSVQAGITLDNLQHNLESAGKFLPLEAPLSNDATIGGILSASSLGPLRRTYGLPRDWLIGLKVISSEGIETKSGGQVVKNVTGYDLNKLYSGSLGTLGVIVEAVFKLAPKPANHSVVLASFPSQVEALKAGQHLLQQIYSPQGLHLINSSAGAHLFNKQLRDPEGYKLVTIFTGRSKAITRCVQETTNLLKTLETSDLSEHSGAVAVGIIRDLNNLGYTEIDRSFLRVNINFPPSFCAQIIDWLKRDSTYGGETNQRNPDSEPTIGHVIDIGFGSGSLIFWDDSGVQANDLLRLRTFLNSIGGSAIIEQCPIYLKKEVDIWGHDPSGIGIMRDLKNNFDPYRTLNPGRFISGI